MPPCCLAGFPGPPALVSKGRTPGAGWAKGLTTGSTGEGSDAGSSALEPGRAPPVAKINGFCAIMVAHIPRKRDEQDPEIRGGASVPVSRLDLGLRAEAREGHQRQPSSEPRGGSTALASGLGEDRRGAAGERVGHERSRSEGEGSSRSGQHGAEARRRGSEQEQEVGRVAAGTLDEARSRGAGQSDPLESPPMVAS